MSAVPTYAPVVLERAAQELVLAASSAPFADEPTPGEARDALDRMQGGPVVKLPVDDTWVTVPADVGDVGVRIVRPHAADGPLPAVVYLHGGGWMLGNSATHDRLVRELAVGGGAAVVFVDYRRSPEARYPVAIEQGYAVAQWIALEGAAHGLDPTRLAVAGDGAGGCLAAALTLLAQERGDVRFVHQSLYYPVTDAAMDTDSYDEFAEGYYLTARTMARFWDAYVPDRDRRSDPLASPLRARHHELAGLPPALVVVAEADVVRDEGEAYAARLREAGVPVATARYPGITHDFMVLDPLRQTRAARAAIAQATSALREALHRA
jgi:acetyl esterase/lipase